MLDSQFQRGDDLDRRFDEMLEITEAARDAGYQSIFGVHHYLADIVTPQPLTALARLIPHTGTMQLGTGVYFSTIEHPIRLAENAATLDQLSGGRLVLGLGAGYRPEEFDSFGVDRDSRWSRLAETVQLLEQLWSGAEVNHAGQHFTVTGQKISLVPHQRPRPPIWIGANGPATVLRAAAIGDTWLAPPNVKARWAKGNLAAFQDELRRNGHDPAGRDYPIMRELFVAETDDLAESISADYIKREYASLAHHNLDHFVTMFDDLRRKAFMIGSPQTVVDQINDLAEAGFNHVIFRVRWADMPLATSLRSLRLCAEEVLPQFNRA